MHDVGNLRGEFGLALGRQLHLVPAQDRGEDRNEGLVHQVNKGGVGAPGFREDVISETGLPRFRLAADDARDGGCQLRVASAEIVDGLLRVTHPEASLPGDFGEAVEDLHLGGIGVLELVHEDVIHGVRDILPHLRIFKQTDEMALHVVEAHQVVLLLVTVILGPPFARNPEDARHHVLLHLTDLVAGVRVGEEGTEKLHALLPAFLETLD